MFIYIQRERESLSTYLAIIENTDGGWVGGGVGGWGLGGWEGEHWSGYKLLTTLERKRKHA